MYLRKMIRGLRDLGSAKRFEPIRSTRIPATLRWPIGYDKPASGRASIRVGKGPGLFAGHGANCYRQPIRDA